MEEREKRVGRAGKGNNIVATDILIRDEWQESKRLSEPRSEDPPPSLLENASSGAARVFPTFSMHGCASCSSYFFPAFCRDIPSYNSAGPLRRPPRVVPGRVIPSRFSSAPHESQYLFTSAGKGYRPILLMKSHPDWPRPRVLPNPPCRVILAEIPLRDTDGRVRKQKSAFVL